MITELKISNIFSNNDKYEIPLYQRAYAWKEREISQLIEDICDFTGESYYLGSLVVSRNEHDTYEVIDGQQRLTTLFIILKCLGYKIQNSLTFSCREKSNYTLANLTNQHLDDKQIEESIRQGKDIVNCKFRESSVKDTFERNLKKAIIYRIEVPKHTDLNRYFEIMNTRGEQLEQHDILKATLMSRLTDDRDKIWFAKIWDACSDMTGYVQMHFDTHSRKILFGDRWDTWQKDRLDDLRDNVNVNSTNSNSIDEIIMDNYNNHVESDNESEGNIRFNSIIEFPHFLLHVLKVFVDAKDINAELEEQLDDKKLCSSFEKAFNVLDKETFAKEFIIHLLKCRFLFDKYIIKREFANDDLDGEWSLKELMQSMSGKSAKAYYVNTVLKGKQNQTKRIVEENKLRAKRVLMLQACYRVSYTSPKVMHWITTLLKWLYENDLNSLTSYEEVNERIAQEAVKNNFLTGENFRLGVSTPHIVFNYLDYLLWKKNPDVSFNFEFRNSVEHWYPQNPSSETFDTWDDVDYFGNLCIIQREINAKFSNLDPEGKKTTFEKMIEKGSLKLRLMSNITSSKQDWKKRGAYSHGDEMIKLLKEACN